MRTVAVFAKNGQGREKEHGNEQKCLRTHQSL